MIVSPEDVAKDAALTQESAGAGAARSRQIAVDAVTLLTGGGDPHYAFGLSASLVAQGVTIDLIGSDEFEVPAFQENRAIRFLNLRGSVNPTAGSREKIVRITKYYLRLIRYALTAKPRIFHILWNNKFEWFDRTLLLLYYRMLGKKIVLTAHNVNAGRRDQADTWINRITLRIQYHLASCIFVHTEKMKHELHEEFGVSPNRIGLIPYGINNAVPHSALTPVEARGRLGIAADERVLLLFGRINPYKGVEYLVSAFRRLCARTERYRLIIAGRPEDWDGYWRPLVQRIEAQMPADRLILATDFIPDDTIEIYFKAADALVLPYRHIYQSGVLFLGQSFGLPVLASDVGSFKEEIAEGETGFIFKPEDSDDLLRAIDAYFASDLYTSLNAHRLKIQQDAALRHSWDAVARITLERYDEVAAGTTQHLGAVQGVN